MSTPALMLMNAEGLKQLDQLRLLHAGGLRPGHAARMFYDGPSGQRRTPGRPTVSMSNGVATVEICGPMFAEPDPMHTYFGMEQVVYGELISVCEELIGSAALTGVQLEIDTPGGAERGFDEAYAALCQLTAAFPTVARLRGCCSAGQWMAFACAKENTAAYPDAMLGSIGCILMLTDKSKMYEQAGVLPCPVASGDNKSFLGVDGLPITEKHKQNAMGLIVAPRFAQFKAAAMKARGLAENADVFDGRVLN
ncbi:MAG TPA: S49 family peptidase, partial [Phycisphaerales bacterium]|nr:S49 family peptidase [Phycisphaerales bacterium]